jgi:hypothetical protein
MTDRAFDVVCIAIMCLAVLGLACQVVALVLVLP